MSFVIRSFVPAGRPFDIVGPIARGVFVAAQIAGIGRRMLGTRRRRHQAP
jgi:hypothetical protein